MTQMPLVSIIVPVYKVEKFLDHCVESLVRQSYENIEIILVDDGSPDACPAMCDAWAEKDERIRVLHKANGGQAWARNQAVAIAKGEYISFVDSDDYVSADAIEYLVKLMIDSDADIVCGSFREVYDSEELFENQPEEVLICTDNIGACKEFFGDNYMPLVTLWGKIFPVEILRRFPLPEGHRHEDEAVIYKYYYYSKKTIISNRKIYAYYQNPESITHNKTRKHYEDGLSARQGQLDFFLGTGNMELAALAAEKMCMSAVAIAGQGENVYKEYIKNNPHPEYLKLLKFKRRLLYRVYALLGIDLNAILLKLKKLG